MKENKKQMGIKKIFNYTQVYTARGTLLIAIIIFALFVMNVHPLPKIVWLICLIIEIRILEEFSGYSFVKQK